MKIQKQNLKMLPRESLHNVTVPNGIKFEIVETDF